MSDEEIERAAAILADIKAGARERAKHLQPNQCPGCGSYRLDGRPPLLHEYGCPWKGATVRCWGTEMHDQNSAQSTRRLSAQQREVLRALRLQSPMPTTILRDVKAPYGYTENQRWMKIGEPVGAVLRRLEKRGFVTGEASRDCKDWWISDAGIAALEGS